MNTKRQMISALIAIAAAVALPAPAFAADADRSVGERVDDTALAAKVKAALIASEEAKARRVEVETRSGVVTLTGFADTRQEADAAVRAARGVSGVKSVTDAIQVGVTR